MGLALANAVGQNPPAARSQDGFRHVADSRTSRATASTIAGSTARVGWDGTLLTAMVRGDWFGG
jgi:hypothetical protein